MASDRKVVKIVTSGVPHLYPDVHIYDTVLSHISDNHPEEHSRLDDIYQTIEKPDLIYQSKTHNTSVILVNTSSTSASGDPLRVIVKNVSDGTALMSTAYFTSSANQGLLLWTLNDGK